VGIPRGAVWLLALTVVVYVVRGIFRAVRLLLDQRRVHRELLVAMQKKLDDARANIDEARAKIDKTSWSPSENPDDVNTVMTLLASEHPRPVEVSATATRLSFSYVAAEKLAEEMESSGLLTILPGLYSGKAVMLTPPGRDYCLEHGLDLI
jgi:predicted AAA+ superfamily ATPase